MNMDTRVRKKANTKISLISLLRRLFSDKPVPRVTEQKIFNTTPIVNRMSTEQETFNSVPIINRGYNVQREFIPVTANRTDSDYLYVPMNEREFTEKDLIGMAKNWYEISPEDYFDLLERKKKYQSEFDFTGIYLIHNLNFDVYYVGQSVHVLQRVRQHFTGKGGNPDVYFDYRSGDQFTIQTLSLTESKYQSLNRLEKDAIDCYDAFDQGYNNTIGNKD